MKSLKITALLLSCTAFAYAQEVTVKGNSKLNVDFSKYKTFSWAKTDETGLRNGDYEIYSYSEEVSPSDSRTAKNKKTSARTNQKVNKTQRPEKYYYSYNVIIPAADASTNAAIQRSIAQELEGRGYQKGEGYGDLIVTYKVLDKRSKIKGYNNDTPETVQGEQIRQPEDTATYFLDPGSIMISLIDNKTSQVVWDGFATGLSNGDAFITDPMKVKEAIHLIFEEFKYRADKISGDNPDSNNNNK